MVVDVHIALAVELLGLVITSSDWLEIVCGRIFVRTSVGQY